MTKYDDDFVAFCKDHTMKEIIAKYGMYGKNKVYQSKPHIPFRKEPAKGPNELALKILEDVKNGMKQNLIAQKYGVSRQYVSALKLKEMKNGKLF